VCSPISYLPPCPERVKGRPEERSIGDSLNMIYQEKTPAMDGRPAEQLDSYPLPRPAGAQELNHRAVRSKARSQAHAITLLDKVRNFESADQIRASGLYPYFRTISSAQDTEVLIEGKKVLMLGSNSYLGLTNHPKIKQAAIAAVAKYGTGCAGSRFLNGTLDIHLELESALARLVNKEAVLLYSTGFQVNLGVISALVGKGEYVIGDKSNHASIVDLAPTVLNYLGVATHEAMEGKALL